MTIDENVPSRGVQVLENASGVGDDDPADCSLPDWKVPLKEALDHRRQELEAVHIHSGLRLIEEGKLRAL